MIKEFIEAWDKNKDKLENEIKNNLDNLKSFSYKELLCFTLKILGIKIDGVKGIDIERMQEIDFGDYQGTLIFVYPEERYQPLASETFYTIVEYGSCCGCDELQRIQYCGDETQVKDYMTLCLQMIQNTHRFNEMNY